MNGSQLLELEMRSRGSGGMSSSLTTAEALSSDAVRLLPACWLSLRAAFLLAGSGQYGMMVSSLCWCCCVFRERDCDGGAGARAEAEALCELCLDDKERAMGHGREVDDVPEEGDMADLREAQREAHDDVVRGWRAGREYGDTC